MTRFITIEDDEGGPRTRLTVNHNVITSVVIGSDTADGLPAEILDALLPFVGLPGGGARRNANGSGRSRTPATLDPPGWPTPSAVSRAAAALSPGIIPPVDFIPERAEPLPVPEPEPAPEPRPVQRVAQNRQGTKIEKPTKGGRHGQGRKWPMPSDEEFDRAIAELGASPSKLGTRFKTPPSTVSQWLKARRERT